MTLIVSIVGVWIGDRGLGTENVMGLLFPLNRSIDLNLAVLLPNHALEPKLQDLLFFCGLDGGSIRRGLQYMANSHGLR